MRCSNGHVVDFEELECPCGAQRPPQGWLPDPPQDSLPRWRPNPPPARARWQFGVDNMGELVILGVSLVASWFVMGWGLGVPILVRIGLLAWATSMVLAGLWRRASSRGRLDRWILVAVLPVVLLVALPAAKFGWSAGKALVAARSADRAPADVPASGAAAACIVTATPQSANANAIPDWAQQADLVGPRLAVAVRLDSNGRIGWAAWGLANAKATPATTGTLQITGECVTASGMTPVTLMADYTAIKAGWSGLATLR